MKEKMKSALERFSKAIVQPLMYLSVAGTVLILGILLTNGSITAKIPFLQAAPFQLVGKLIYNCLMFLINNLSVIFCVGIAGALAKKNKGHASLIALMSYFLFLNANNITLSFIGRLAEMGPLGLYGTGQSTVLGIQVLDMGVFSGITLGCLTGYVFNKYGEKQFKGYFWGKISIFPSDPSFPVSGLRRVLRMAGGSAGDLGSDRFNQEQRQCGTLHIRPA